MMMFPSGLLAAASLLVAAGAAFGQDSVPTTPGGNDALAPYDGTLQKLRYVVDAVPASTSWNNPVLIAPVLKATRDIDPAFRTQILGSAAISPTLARDLTFAQRPYALWNAPGQGLHPSFNTSPASLISVTGFATQFAIASSDFSLNPSNAVGATVGRDASNPARLYVERTIAATSRPGPSSADTATLSYGAADALGNVYLRADNFNTLTTTTNRVAGDNILRINLDTRAAVVNTLSAAGGINSAADPGATSFIVSNETTPTNVPSGVLQPGVGPFGLIFDFTSRLRSGSSTANLTNLAGGHLASGIAGHRGNPSYSALTPAGGTAGTVATLALPSTGTRVNALDASGLNFGPGGNPPTVAPGTQRAATLPAPINGPNGFTANAAGTASFKQYLSQVPFRGGSGLVGIGQNASGQLILAATANDPAQGDFIAVATFTGGAASWTVAAFPNQPVLNGPGGVPIGTLASPTTTISAPAVDRLGNIYFVATWTPTLSPVATGLFKAVNTAYGYQLELLLSTGQPFTGANSTRPYTITSMALTDSDSLASGAFHAQHLLQEQAPTAQTGDPLNIRAFGGAIVNVVLSYNNNGVIEAYDAVLFVAPGGGTTCPADFNGSGGVTVQDIFDYLGAYFAGLPAADFNGVGGVTVQDIFDFLNAYFTPCP